MPWVDPVAVEAFRPTISSSTEYVAVDRVGSIR
jgi:hypothetical protein